MNQQIKDLKKLIKLCRIEGVTALKMGDIEFHLTPAAPDRVRPGHKPTTPKLDDKGPKVEGEMTDEELLFWSSTTPGMENQLNG